jgi:hypothetical protein
MTSLAIAIFCILTDSGEVPIFRVETYDLCLQLLEISLADAKCIDLSDPL